MKREELNDIYDFDVCPLCHDIMPDDTELRERMHGEGRCDNPRMRNVQQAPTERAKKVLQ